jgi:hypothetical protein
MVNLIRINVMREKLFSIGKLELNIYRVYNNDMVE